MVNSSVDYLESMSAALMVGRWVQQTVEYSEALRVLWMADLKAAK